MPRDFPAIVSILLIQLACLLTKGGLAAVAFHLYSSFGANLASELTLRVYSHLQRQSFLFQLDRGQSELLQLLRGDMAIIEGGLSHLAGQALVGALQISIVLALMLAWYPALFLLGLIGLSGMVALTYAAARLSERELSREIQENVRVGEHILKTLGIRGFLLRVSSWSDWGTTRLRAALRDYTRTLIHRRTRPNWLTEASHGVGYAMQFVLYLIGGHLATSGKMSLGGLVAFAALFTYLSSGAQQLAPAVVGLIDGYLHLQRVEQELNTSSELPQPASPAPVASLRGAYEFLAVSFGYPDGGRSALNDLTLNIPPGSVTAVVGRSGSGKTSLGYLMLRFFDPTSGEILLDGLPLCRYASPELWRQIGYVPQEPMFFRGSIRENLLLGRDAPDADLERACRAAAIDDRILQAGGYDARLAEIGYSFSGGERQRLAVARALVHPPPILILDEPTAHLDEANERCLLEVIRQVADSGKTVVFLAHRLSAALPPDQIVVLDSGRLVACGSLNDLAPARPDDQELLRQLGCQPGIIEKSGSLENVNSGGGPGT